MDHNSAVNEKRQNFQIFWPKNQKIDNSRKLRALIGGGGPTFSYTRGVGATYGGGPICPRWVQFAKIDLEVDTNKHQLADTFWSISQNLEKISGLARRRLKGNSYG